MSEEGPKLTLFQKMRRYCEDNRAIAFVMLLSIGIIALAALITAILVITASIEKVANGSTPRGSESNESVAIEVPPTEEANTSSTDGEAVSRAGRGPIQSAPSELDSRSRRKHVSPGAIEPVPTEVTTPQETSTPARWVDIESSAPGNVAGPRWAFVAKGRSEGGYLYPYVADAYGGRFVGSPLQSNGNGSWFGDAPIGDSETKSGTTYSVFVIWSAKSIPTNRTGALPSTAEIISRPATVTRR